MYTVIIKTMDVESEHRKPFIDASGRQQLMKGHGTHANISLKLAGTNGESPIVFISGRNGQITYDGQRTDKRAVTDEGPAIQDNEPFEAGETARLQVPDPELNLGRLTHLAIELIPDGEWEPGDAWHLDEVVVVDEENDVRVQFPCVCWLAPEGGPPDDPYQLQVTLRPLPVPVEGEEEGDEIPSPAAGALFTTLHSNQGLRFIFDDAVDQRRFQVAFTGAGQPTHLQDPTAALSVSYWHDPESKEPVRVDVIPDWNLVEESVTGSGQYTWEDPRTLLLAPPAAGWPTERFVRFEFAIELASVNGGAIAGERVVIAQVALPDPLRLIGVEPFEVAPGPAPAEPRSNSLTILVDTRWEGVVRELSAEFASASGLEIAVESADLDDIRSIVLEMADGHRGPDIFAGRHEWLGQLVSAGAVSELGPGPDTLSERFVPATLEAFRYQGLQFGLPVVMDTVALVYNAALLERLGSEPLGQADSWKSMHTWAKEVEAAAAADNLQPLHGFVLPSNGHDFMSIQSAFGGYLFGKDEQGSNNPRDLGIDQEGSWSAVRWLVGMRDDGFVHEAEGDDALQLFADGRAAAILTQRRHMEMLNELIEGLWVTPPLGDGQSFITVQGFMLNAFGRDPELGRQFLLEVLSQVGPQSALWESTISQMPAHLEVADMVIGHQSEQGFFETARRGQPVPAIPEMEFVWSQWDRAIKDILVRARPPEDAVFQAANSIRAHIG